MTKLIVAIMATIAVFLDSTSLSIFALILLLADDMEYRRKSDAAEFLRKSKK